MQIPLHPGLSVRHDCLEPLGLTVTEAARKLEVSRKQMSDVVNLRSGISPDMAIRLDKVFGGGAKLWYQLQADYDLAKAMTRFDKNMNEAMWGPTQGESLSEDARECILALSGHRPCRELLETTLTTSPKMR